jgi:hypothetical protein
MARKKPTTHAWEFRPRFRRCAFGWRSQPAVQRVHQAVSEIKKVARKDKLLAAEGAVLFLEKVSPALEQVDSSSGAIGSAVNGAIATLVPIIAGAPTDATQRDAWLERLWDAYQDDGIPYIEMLGDYWGELCGSKEVASQWADRLVGTCKMAFSPDPNLRGFFKGTTNCLSSLLAAERYEELLELVAMESSTLWHYHRYAVKAMAAMGRLDEAIRYAEEGPAADNQPMEAARECEELLLEAGRAEEAYTRFGLVANQTSTYLAWFRAVVKKYPHKTPAQILADLVFHTPGEEGKWFAAAKDAGLFGEAISLANESPCAPQTLTRAARDFAATNPAFAMEAGLAALRWLVAGYGYEITGLDVLGAYDCTMKAAANAGREEEARRCIRVLLAEPAASRFVVDIFRRHVDLRG